MTSATGISATDPLRRVVGFTLIEVMVVVTIIAVLLAGAVLSLNLGGAGSDARQLAGEAERIQRRLGYMRELAIIEGRPYGVHVTGEGYRSYAFDVRNLRWTESTERALRPARWSGAADDSIYVELFIEGKPVVLDKTTGDPQFGVDAEGEYTAFALQLSQLGAGVWRVQPDAAGGLELLRMDRPRS
jgi:type II secretion system protein H